MYDVPELDNNGDDKKIFPSKYNSYSVKYVFWCASNLSSTTVSVAKCPNCYNS